MTVWIIIIALAALVLAAMLLLGKLPRRVWEVSAAFILIGLFGYYLQGRPDLPGVEDRAREPDLRATATLVDLRAKMAPNFDGSRRWTNYADGQATKGNYADAAAWVKSGLKQQPNDPDLWAALGLYMMLAADGRIDAPAQYAFSRARAIHPRHPAPDYFEGLDALVKGDPRETLRKWSAALEKNPADDEWKPIVERQLAGLKEAARRAMQDQQARPEAAAEERPQ